MENIPDRKGRGDTPVAAGSAPSAVAPAGAALWEASPALAPGEGPRAVFEGRSGHFSISASRPFRGPVSKAMAESAALSAARLQAVRAIAVRLARTERVRFAMSSESARPGGELDILALAAAVMNLDSLRGEIIGLPPDLYLSLDASFSSADDKGTLDVMRWLLRDNPALDNYALALQMEEELLLLADEQISAQTGIPRPLPEFIAGEAERRRPSVHGRGASELLSAQGNQVYASLRAVRLYMSLLPGLYSWDELGPGLLAPLEEAAALNPENFLIAAELGRLYLWLELPAKAREVLDKSLALNPDFDQALGHSGATWVLLGRPSLASLDFGRAISIAPRTAIYRLDRAMVWKALGNAEAMCVDLEEACVLGNCAAYEWSVSVGECARPDILLAPDPSRAIEIRGQQPIPR